MKTIQYKPLIPNQSPSAPQELVRARVKVNRVQNNQKSFIDTQSVVLWTGLGAI